METDPHTCEKSIYVRTAGRVLVLCAKRHFVTSITTGPKGDWAGSSAEAEAGQRVHAGLARWEDWGVR
jgi:hypothetical protein